MKKKAIAYTILILSILLINGCGNSSASTPEFPSENVQKKSLREMKHGFNPDTNKTLTFGGITVTFPDYWIQYNDDDDNPFYCAETGDKIAELLFKYDGTQATEEDFLSGLSDMTADYLENKTSDLKDVAIGVTSESKDIPACAVGYHGKMDDKEMAGRCCFVYDPLEKGILIIDLRQTDNTDYIYSGDFNEMVENIKVEGSLKQEPVENDEEIYADIAETDDEIPEFISGKGNEAEEEQDDPEEDEEVSDTETTHKVFPYPGEDEITNVDDYKSFYRNYKSAYNQNWYRLTMPVYSVSGNSIIVHDDLNKVLGMISVEFAEPGTTSSIRRGDEVTVVAITRSKMLGTLMMYSGYLDGMRKTANSIVDGQVIVVDDYVSFAQKYESQDIGKTIQITAKVRSVTDSGFSIDEGFPDGVTYGISVSLADGETTNGIKDGDTVTFYGVTHSKLWNMLYIDDAHIGAAKGDSVVNYKDTEAYAEKNKPKTYMQCTVSQMVADMENNPMSAKDRYLDKDLQVTGIITKIDDKGKYFYIGVNSSSGTSESVYCSVESEEQRKKLMNLSKGNTVTVCGRCYAAGDLLIIPMGFSMNLDDILTGY